MPLHITIVSRAKFDSSFLSRFHQNASSTSYRTGRFTWQVQLFLLFIFTAAVITRRLDVLTKAQFYAEDGGVWYADAYNLGGAHALTITAGGYLNTMPRLVAWFSLLFPLRTAPLIMNLFGILIQVIPASFLISDRCATWWPLRTRLLQAAIYIALPNSREIHVVLTNAQFHMALLAVLVVLAAPPNKWYWRLFDVLVIVVSSLTGPFCIPLLAITSLSWWVFRRRWSLILVSILAPLVAVQGIELLAGGYAIRAPAHLGATLELFFRILSGHVYVGSIHGQNGFAVSANAFELLVVTVLGTAVFAYCFMKGPVELRLFVLFCLLIFAASLSTPLLQVLCRSGNCLQQTGALATGFSQCLGYCGPYCGARCSSNRGHSAYSA